MRPLVPPSLGPRIDFRPEHFRRQLINQGLDFLHERRSRCSCSRIHNVTGSVEARTKAGRVGCPTCGGSGSFYMAGLPVKALTMSAGENPRYFEVYGDLAVGAVRLTLMPETLPGKLDRFVLLGRAAADGHTQAAVRTIDGQFVREGATTKTEFPIVMRQQAQGTVDDPTVPELVWVGVDSLRRATPEGVAIPGDCVYGTDFSVNSAGDLVWIDAGDPPAMNTVFSIRHHAHPVYVARFFPNPNRDNFVAGYGESGGIGLVNQTVVVDCWLHDMDPWPKAES